MRKQVFVFILVLASLGPTLNASATDAATTLSEAEVLSPLLTLTRTQYSRVA